MRVRVGFFTGEVLLISHIHLPDGVLPFAWWFTAGLLAAGWLLLALRQLQRGGRRLPVPLLGAVGACMLLTMSVPLGPLPVHLNLTVLAGMLAGPWLGFIAVFLVNVMLSLLGHGGLTAVALNSLLMGVEVLLGWWVFHHLLRRCSFSWRAFMAPILALVISISLSLGVVGWSTGLWSAVLPGVHHAELHEHQPAAQPVSVHDNSLRVGLAEALHEWHFLGSTGLAALGLLFGLGLFCEAGATLVIARYLHLIRPDLLQGGSD